MRLAFATSYDPLDVDRFSGTAFYMLASLRGQGLNVRPVGPLTEDASGLLAGADRLGEQVARKLRELRAEVVFSAGYDCVAFLRCAQPVVFWHDVTYASWINYYNIEDPSGELIERARAIDAAALENCRLAVFASEWAAKNAVADYGVCESRVRVLPFGANFDSGLGLEEVRAAVNGRTGRKCKLLCVGTEWHRKGFDMALRLVAELRGQGMEAELTVVGCVPEGGSPLPDYARAPGYISKSTRAGREAMERLFSEATFLVGPSRAECYGIVFAEASSFGLPSLATRTGGIPSVVKDDVNGRLFDLKADVSEYCSYIEDLMSDGRKYRELSLSAFREYETRLNWRVGARSVRNLLRQY
ncbi:MAG: glycosyltransferase family 4 protein, partial [Acidobacteriota bacterium]|nr:glycosyltransferase family 4 protein [Acidobacteriota bacterium]